MQTEIQELAKKIMLIVCAEEGISPDIVLKKTRIKEIKEARQIIAYFCRKYINDKYGNPLSFQEVGNFIGKDHATVMYICKTLDGWILTNRVFRDKMEKYDNLIKDYSGLHSLDVSLLLAEKIKRQMTVLRKDFALLEEITKKLIPDLPDTERYE